LVQLRGGGGGQKTAGQKDQNTREIDAGRFVQIDLKKGGLSARNWLLSRGVLHKQEDAGRQQKLCFMERLERTASSCQGWGIRERHLGRRTAEETSGTTFGQKNNMKGRTPRGQKKNATKRKEKK